MRERFFVAVAGTPGVGKTAFSSKLAGKVNARLVDLKEYAVERNLVSGRDKERDTLVVDEGELKRRLSREFSSSRGDFVVEGLLAPFTPATHVIALRCSPRELARRLKKRGYGRKKIKENVEAEVLGVCLHDSLWCENLLELDVTRGFDVGEAVAWLKKGGRKIKRMNWFKEYAKMLEEGF